MGEQKARLLLAFSHLFLLISGICQLLSGKLRWGYGKTGRSTIVAENSHPGLLLFRLICDTLPVVKR
jgi:hypothetical protein